MSAEANFREDGDAPYSVDAGGLEGGLGDQGATFRDQRLRAEKIAILDERYIGIGWQPPAMKPGNACCSP